MGEPPIWSRLSAAVASLLKRMPLADRHPRSSEMHLPLYNVPRKRCTYHCTLYRARDPRHVVRRYKMGELEGMNVTAIMPPPFSQQHNNYLRAYKQTGVSAVLNRKREVVAMAKDRTVFPVMLGVTKMVQSDGSVQFLGVIKRKHAEDRYAELWVTSAGGVLCASEGFQALTGFTSMELANTAVDSLSFMVRSTRPGSQFITLTTYSCLLLTTSSITRVFVPVSHHLLEAR